MMKRLIPILAVPVIALAACAGQSAPATPVEVTRQVEVTREVEVTRVVEVEVPAPPAEATPAPTTDAEPAAGMASKTLADVKERGKLLCGVNGQLPGFSFGDGANMAGFDADMCRAIAAAIFGDKNAVEFKPYSAETRFDALKSDDVDVLIRNTTWTLGRDAEGFSFTSPIFYDGQSLMVRNDSGIAGLPDLDGDSVCVQKGTTTEGNLAEFAATSNITFTINALDSADATFAAYADGTCKAVTADKTALITRRGVLADPQNHLILDGTLSKEPLAAVVRQDDAQWLDVVNWVLFAPMAAEEYAINAQNADAAAEGDARAEVKRMLGSDPQVDMGAALGLPRAWALNVVKAVGNYAEIYDRHFGPTTVNQIPRGLNNLYRNGGLLYAPPFR